VTNDDGIRFPAEDLARAFSFESMMPNGPPFGFHGLFNMWMVIPPHLLAEFVGALAPSSVTGPQMLRLGKNYIDLKRPEEAAIVLRRRLQVVPGDQEARQLLDRLGADGPAAVAAVPAPPAAADEGGGMASARPGWWLTSGWFIGSSPDPRLTQLDSYTYID